MRQEAQSNVIVKMIASRLAIFILCFHLYDAKAIHWESDPQIQRSQPSSELFKALLKLRYDNDVMRAKLLKTMGKLKALDELSSAIDGFQEPYQEEAYRNSAKIKRRGSSCLFHAGLASNCDYKDLVGAVNEVSHWGSDLAPGRKKRAK